jgi:Holliday junction DNA helicase RuvB
MLTAPLRDRFGVICRLDYYTTEELYEIIIRSSRILKIKVEKEGAIEIARRSRGTPRVANRLLKRVRDYAQVKAEGIIDKDTADKALKLLEIDDMGLDDIDKKMLMTIIEKFDGGPVGLDTLAASIGEDSGTIEDVYEPYLLQIGFINRTARGRITTNSAYKHFGISRE